MTGVALIGYGYAGRTFHAPLIRATPGLALVVVSSSRPQQVRADLPGIDVVGSPAEACAAATVDLVVVATPNDSHVAVASIALAAGKHVVVEKPFAPTLDEARALTSLAQRRNRVLAVFQNRRWDGDFLAVRDLLDRRVLGDVAHFESHFDRYRPVVRDRWRERAGEGVGPHLADQALQLFGLPDRVSASRAAQRAGAQSDDWAHVVLEYSRLRVVLHTSVLVAAPSPRFIVHGHNGSWIKHGFDAQERELVAALDGAGSAPAGASECAVLVDGATGTERDARIPPGNYGEFYRQLHDALQGTGRNPVPPAQALAVMAVVETAVRSSVEGRALALPLTEAEVRAFND
jgi:predicted dehydrogenase